MADPAAITAEQAAIDHPGEAPGDAIVEEHLDHAASLEGMTQDHGGGHESPSILGIFDPVAVVALSMTVFLGILIWKKVPGAIAGGLDSKITAIKQQLDEARALRAEAEALRKEYADKIANAEKDAESMLDHAKVEADQIVAKAEADSEAMIARRKQMAEDKIGAAQRAAIDELRSKAATTAANAARGLIAKKHDASADKKLVDEAITGI